MIDRRKIIAAGLAGAFIPVCAVLAQQPPEERKDAPAIDHSHDQPHAVDHAPPHPVEHVAEARPHMPPPRHEVRPRSPGASYHWRDGHWNWDGHQWAWMAGVWYH